MVKFRCSELNFLLTDPKKGSKDPLSKTTYTYLNEVFVREQYGRSKEIKSKYLEKGTIGESESLNLLSEVTGRLLFKNTIRTENEYITGEWDTTHEGVVIDTKTSWDIFTFSNATLEPKYIAQLIGYMWLLGYKKAELAYCLVDTPEHLIIDMFWREMRSQNVIDISDQRKYEIAKNHIYTQDYLDVMHSAHFPDADVSDFIAIPAKDRVKIYHIEYDQDLIDNLKERITISREVLKEMTL